MSKHDNTAPTVFPEIPRDNVTLGLLSSLKDLTLKISHNNMLEKDPELQKICGYLFVISDAPVNHPYAYFRFHEALKEESFNRKLGRLAQNVSGTGTITSNAAIELAKEVVELRKKIQQLESQ